VPGGFENETNYLTFDGTGELIAAAYRLIEDPDLRASMMHNNHEYYRKYMRPDALVRNSLDTIFESVGGKAVV
jgi:hypothetical protein